MSSLFYLPRVHSQTGAKLYFRASATSTPQNVYADVDLATPHSNPVVADAGGYFPPIYLDPSLPNYRMIHTDGSNVDDDYTLEVLLEPIRDDIPASQTASKVFRLKDTTPQLIFEETDQAAGSKKWRVAVNGNQLVISSGDDAESTWVDAIVIARDGTVTVADLVADSVDTGGVPISLQTGSFTGTLTGMDAATTGTVYYQILNGFARMWVTSTLSGTSNAGTLTLTGAPAALFPAATRNVGGFQLVDNAGDVLGAASVATSGVVTFGKRDSFTTYAAFTSSGTKGLFAGWSIGYPL